MAIGLVTIPITPAAPLFTASDYAAQRAFFAARPALGPTPSIARPDIAQRLGIGTLIVKDETARFGLNAFKAAGATFAVATLAGRGDIRSGDTLVCASEGNHGRAVARAARDHGCDCRVYVSESIADARAAAMAAEGAAVVRVAGTYDEAVRVMAGEARRHAWTIVSDTSWDGYDEIPRLIMLGYTRLLDEAAADWAIDGPPDVIAVPAGVGGLLAAVASWTTSQPAGEAPRVLGVEPLTAACVQASVAHGRPVTLEGPFETVMAGLRCGEVSRVAFEALRTVTVYVAIEDRWAFDAMRMLAHAPAGTQAVRAGASGAAALGGVMAVVQDPALAELRGALGLGPGSRVLVLVTEGPTDPALFEQVVGDPDSGLTGRD